MLMISLADIRIDNAVPASKFKESIYDGLIEMSLFKQEY